MIETGIVMRMVIMQPSAPKYVSTLRVYVYNSPDTLFLPSSFF